MGRDGEKESVCSAPLALSVAPYAAPSRWDVTARSPAGVYSPAWLKLCSRWYSSLGKSIRGVNQASTPSGPVATAMPGPPMCVHLTKCRYRNNRTVTGTCDTHAHIHTRAHKAHKCTYGHMQTGQLIIHKHTHTHQHKHAILNTQIHTSRQDSHSPTYTYIHTYIQHKHTHKKAHTRKPKQTDTHIHTRPTIT